MVRLVDTNEIRNIGAKILNVLDISKSFAQYFNYKHELPSIDMSFLDVNSYFAKYPATRLGLRSCQSEATIQPGAKIIHFVQINKRTAEIISSITVLSFYDLKGRKHEEVPA